MIGRAEKIVTSLCDCDDRFVITGATGWLGQALLALLSETCGEVLEQRVLLGGSVSRQITAPDGRNFPVHALDELVLHLDDRPVMLFHFAFLTKDKVGRLSDTNYVAYNKQIASVIGELATKSCVKGIVLASSGAVYDHLEEKSRDDSANLYGRLKFEDEQLFGDICERRRIPLVIPRIFNLAGPYINKFQSYALSSIIVNVLRGQAVNLKASHKVWRSYVHVRDVLKLSLSLLQDRNTGTLLFDTAGEEVVELGELALRTCLELGRPDIGINRPELVSTTEDRYVGDGTLFQHLLKTHGIQPNSLSTQIRDSAEWIAATLERSSHG